MKPKTKSTNWRLRNNILDLEDRELLNLVKTIMLKYCELDFVGFDEERAIAQALNFQLEGDYDYTEWVIPSADSLRRTIVGMSSEQFGETIKTMLADVHNWLSVEHKIPTFNPRHPYPFWEAIADNIKAIATI